MDITVIYPTYNEEKNLRATIERSLAALRPLFREFEVLIVNDCSKDATPQLAEQLAAEHPEVRVLHNEKNLGSGGAWAHGLRQARGQLITHNGMDYPFDLADLALMMPLLDEADVVVAVRKDRETYTLFRKITSWGNLALLNILFPLRLRDYNFTQLYKRQVLEAVETETRSAAFITPETMIRAHDLGFRVKPIPITYHPRLHGVATSGSFCVIYTSLRDMLRFWVRRLLRRRSTMGPLIPRDEQAVRAAS